LDFEAIDREGGGGRIIIGEGTKIARRVSIDITGDVTIGKRCMISEDALILTHEHDVNDFHNRQKIKVKPLKIEDDVFIGSRAIILPSVNKIESNAFIGAGAVVTKDVQANSIVAGNPARFLRFK